MTDNLSENRPEMAVDIACIGFGPAMGGFLTTISKELTKSKDNPHFQSKAMPGLPLQVVCYERCSDLGFGVSGVVTKGKGIKGSFPDLDIANVPNGCTVSEERLLYLFDPLGASRRSLMLLLIDKILKFFRFLLPIQKDALKIPLIPPFLRKKGAKVFSIGQFNQWVASQLMTEANVQIWPGTPVNKPLFAEDNKVIGLNLLDQGTDAEGKPGLNYSPGMNIKSFLTVVGDGPASSIGDELDQRLGKPSGNKKVEAALGMKVVVRLKDGCPLKPGTIFHTLGYPEPEIFGFLYVYPNNVASLGIFYPSFLKSPCPTAYRYLQHWMLHPYLWQYLEGGTLLSYGAKTLLEMGKDGEPYLAGDGFARIGEGSGTNNILKGAGVDEAWSSGTLLGKAIIHILQNDLPFTKENLQKYYVEERERSWLGRESKIASKSRTGFHLGFIPGVIGMAISGVSHGIFNFPSLSQKETVKSYTDFFKDKISSDEISSLKLEAQKEKKCLHNLLLDRCGWPKIEYDGKLLISQQDALLVGGKVQAPDGFRDHIQIKDRTLCDACEYKSCVEICSGQALTLGEDKMPCFEREKCLHCGACKIFCPVKFDDGGSNITFCAGPGGLHSVEN